MHKLAISAEMTFSADIDAPEISMAWILIHALVQGLVVDGIPMERSEAKALINAAEAICLAATAATDSSRSAGVRSFSGVDVVLKHGTIHHRTNANDKDVHALGDNSSKTLNRCISTFFGMDLASTF